MDEDEQELFDETARIWLDVPVLMRAINTQIMEEPAEMARFLNTSRMQVTLRQFHVAALEYLRGDG